MTEAQDKRRERNRRYYESQKAKKEASRSVRIGDMALARSRQKPRAAIPNIFAPAVPPRSVAAGMALDGAYNETLGWALGGLTQESGVTGFLGYPVLAELAQRPEYRRISEIIAMEMTRRWVRMKADGDDDKTDKIKAIEEAMARLCVRDVFREAVEQDGFFGRGHVFLDFGVTDDREELRQSMGDGQGDLSRLKVAKGSLRRLKAVEAVWCYPNDYNSFDPLRPDWFKPTTWMVQGKEVHASRLLTIIGREVPDLLKPAYSFGGLSLSQMAKPYVDNWLRTRQSVADLISSFSVFILKTNLADKLTMDPNGDELFKRADFFNNLRDNRGLMLTDKELEDFANVSTSLATLDALQAQTQEHMASVSGIPLVKLLGIQPAGLNASSEGELECFEAWIHALQESMLSAPLRTVLGFIQLSLFGAVDPAITFAWEPLKQVTEKDAAEIRKINAETGQVLIAGKVISPEEERQRIASDDDSIYDSIDVAAAPGERLTPVEKATIAAGITGAIVQAESSGLVDTPLAMEELRKLGQATGVWTSVTEADIVEAKLAPPPAPGGFGGPGAPPFGQDEGFKEEDHPRGDDGQFSDGAGEGGRDGDDDDERDLDDDGAPPPPSTLSSSEQAASVAAAIGARDDPYQAVDAELGGVIGLGDLLSDHERDLRRAALFEAKNAALDEKVARGTTIVLDDPSELSERDAEKMERFVGAHFTRDTMGDALGAPLAAVASRHADDLTALAGSFRDRVSSEGFAGKDSPWSPDDWESDQWAKHEDDEDYAGPTPEETEAARREVEDPWIAKTFGDELSLGLKEAMTRFVRQDELAPAAFTADLQRSFSGLSGGDVKARMGSPFFEALAGMRSIRGADFQKVDYSGGDDDEYFARYAGLVKASPEDAARLAPKLTERIAAYLERARKEGTSRPFDGGMDAGWEEDEHPRDDAGKFTAGAGSSGGGGKVKTQAEASAANPRTDGVPREAGEVVASFTSDAEMKAHPAYAAAKAGDQDAALDVVSDLVKPEMIEQARQRFGRDVVYAPVHAEEATGKNRLPTALAALYASETGAHADGSIVQANRAFHTGAKAMDRMIARPLFEGEVKPGARYVIVDDVTVMGATVAEMAHHIRAGGGEVAGVVTLVNAGRSGRMATAPHRIREIERRFGDVVRQELHIDPRALTADEAQFLLNFRDADALRDRISSARDERVARLSSKEGRGPEGGAGEGRQGGLTGKGE
ncbi:anti-CBASS Acb1 family protein [Xanthobacter sp. V0B-10]|uniref:anti-CBASS protein Acb1 family protein n=1 Tax=Xanthobacter albus TaxID=3119929 RepID=UPI00372C9BBD